MVGHLLYHCYHSDMLHRYHVMSQRRDEDLISGWHSSSPDASSDNGLDRDSRRRQDPKRHQSALAKVFILRRLTQLNIKRSTHPVCFNTSCFKSSFQSRSKMLECFDTVDCRAAWKDVRRAEIQSFVCCSKTQNGLTFWTDFSRLSWTTDS